MTEIEKNRMSPLKRRLMLALSVLVVVVLLVLLPPLVNVNRFQRTIASNISKSLGQPVHLDGVTMNILPLPGFTLQNFVVDEDPRFGNEPVMRANTVEARLRWSSLWRGRVEFSTISLDSPSVNLVQSADGRWNIESILLHATSVDAAPTAQKRAGSAPRFPYIEATDGRINLKIGEEKTPFSVTGAEFALWLPNPEEWRLRIQAKPARTDTDASDTGEIRAEATLKNAARLSDVPMQMEMHWRRVPMGEASKVILGYDAGWRGDGDVSLLLDGTLGDASIRSEVHLTDLRRAYFVPSRQMELDAHCEARATEVLRSLRGLRCSIQADPAVQAHEAAVQTSELPAGTLSVTGDVPQIANWSTADLAVKVAAVSPGYALDWLRLFSQRVPASLHATGSLDGAFSYGPDTADMWAGHAECDCSFLLPGLSGKESALPLHIAALVDSDGTGGRALKVGISPLVLPVDKSASKQSQPVTLRGGEIALSINSDGLIAHIPASNPAEFLPALGERFPPLMDSLPGACSGAVCTLERHWGNLAQSWTVQPAPLRAGHHR